MNECTTISAHRSPWASLAASGVHLQSLNRFAPIRQTVQLAQKTVKYSPADKLNDAFITTILAGAHGIVEVNTRLRADLALQRAVGRTGCAEQSVVQETLDHATAENVTQMAHALTTLVRQHSQADHHDDAAAWHMLDVDMSGLPCGPRRRSPPRAISLSSATGADGNWAACWPPAIRKLWSISAWTARHS